ncbi:hypothetical protein C5167_008098 [Papaver somniferum]|uniref:Cation-transporting P-type ATPase C-terminal domain-containing protein n=1 Tax=Papaver somniferum TaxID=3469 RepID=A0A4Y7JXD3_PAPSO|nr:hypothetical protein C5167_008098 [Papaver somniferum]
MLFNGESGTTKKTANIREDRTTPLLELRNICFMGTSGLSGSGTALMVSTGAKTYMSTMFSTIGKNKQPDTFGKSVRNISYWLIAWCLCGVAGIYRYWPSKQRKMESNMVFLGILTFYDPPKSSAKEAFRRLAEKGVEAKVLTGDSLSLAIRVCKEVGIRTTYASTGPDLELLDPSTFHETVQRATVFARLTPTQKLRVVQSLQTAGDHVVGFLGDGVNDSPAMDAADVGISVDSGVSVAKDLADIILLEKDLNVLVSGVERGTITYGNTMKYIKLSVVANVGSIVSLLIAVVLLGYEPLTARQLVVQNFLYNVGQIPIPWDTVEEDYAKFPQRRSSKSIPMLMLWNGPVCSMFDIGCLVFFWCYYEVYHPSSGDKLYHSGWFVEGLLMQTLIIHMIRTEKIPFIQEVASWPVICSTVLISAVGIALPFTPIWKDFVLDVPPEIPMIMNILE